MSFLAPRFSMALSLLARLLSVGIRGGWLAAVLAVEGHAVK